MHIAFTTIDSICLFLIHEVAGQQKKPQISITFVVLKEELLTFIKNQLLYHCGSYDFIFSQGNEINKTKYL